ncbi:MAG: beta-lactamase family protein [Bacteroidetes bacterium]|nr:beta-lactamase family protein [Bacteroidota bacterium]
MKKYTFIIAILLAFQTIVNAQNGTSALLETKLHNAGMSAEHLMLLDQHIEKFINEGYLPGGVFTIVRKGEIVYNKSFGYHSLDKKEPYKKDDIFRLASMTKAFTSVSIMQLYEKGKLGLDDPVFYYIPAFSKVSVIDEFNETDSTYTSVNVKKPITIRHLLTHTSGISYGGFNPGKIQAVYIKSGINDLGLSHPTMSTEEMANLIATAPLIFQPGEKYMYGLNMDVLGRVIEVVSGKTLNNYFKTHIFEPLGMSDTYFYIPKSKQDRLVPVYTYSKDGKVAMASDTDFGSVVQYPKMEDNNHYAGGGGTSGTAKDYITFLQALLNDGVHKGKRILSRKSIELMTSDQMILLNKNRKGFSKTPGITFGLGFALTTEQGKAVSVKSPGTYEWGGVFNTKYFIDPKEDLVFVGMTQIVPFRRGDFWDKMYAILYGAIED